MTALFCCLLARGAAAPHALQQRTGKKRGTGDCAFAGQPSPARTTTRSGPHGVCQCTRNPWLGQSVLPIAASRPETACVPEERPEDAFFLRPWHSWSSGPPDATRVSLCPLPAPNPAEGPSHISLPHKAPS